MDDDKNKSQVQVAPLGQAEGKPNWLVRLIVLGIIGGASWWGYNWYTTGGGREKLFAVSAPASSPFGRGAG